MNQQALPSTRPILDLEYQLWRRPFGDITAIGTWTLDDDKPCVVLVPTYTPLNGERVTPCIVRMAEAFEWTPETGDPTYTAQRTAEFALALGFTTLNEALLRRIFWIVEDCLSDLLKMPPFPRQTEGEAAADVIARDPNTGKILHEGTVIDV